MRFRYVADFVDAKEFSKALMDLSVYVNGEVAKVIRKACVDLYRRIVERTPVDTGRAKANWQLSTVSTSDKKDDIDGFSANEISSIINENASNLKVTVNTDKVVIYNNLEYMSYLERGDSKQAPQGMVAVSLAEFEQHFKKALSEANL